MNVLVIGGGGREHALAWRIAQSPRVERVLVAPGNAGTAEDAENVGVSATDFPGLVRVVRQNDVELTVVGPEAPLAAGIVDAFHAENLRVFGPTKLAAELEASKVFCKTLLRKANVPTAEFRTFDSAEEASRYLQDREDMPVVVKADGLAAGKGVMVCDDRHQALDAVRRIAQERQFGAAGDRLVIEERLHGEEASVLAITDGRTIVTLQPAQDHKPAYDGDRGPNTGGMGAYSPAPVVDDAMLHWIEEHIFVPTVHTMNRIGRPFRGVLYAGLMITGQGPKVLEFNVRFGDPECQPLVMRLQTDLVELLDLAVEGRLNEIDELEWDPRAAVCVVMASEGYPGQYSKGHPIRGLDEAAQLPDVKVFHAGTKRADGQVVTAGGRVLGVTALGENIAQAKRNAYSAVRCIRWRGAWCRKDISDKALQRPQVPGSS
ncbi:MAG TPA: phosphoribosylamine--glycine ligase [Planctomycetaceae bacterium]|nr:phosphoribosylamine--glycine ligase [Planctomycetaceae bacterium]HIQ20221.1 phosphoribosylamine--glycine ligase [Planctomycetota bacterium]